MGDRCKWWWGWPPAQIDDTTPASSNLAAFRHYSSWCRAREGRRKQRKLAEKRGAVEHNAGCWMGGKTEWIPGRITFDRFVRNKTIRRARPMRRAWHWQLASYTCRALDSTPEMKGRTTGLGLATDPSDDAQRCVHEDAMRRHEAKAYS